MSKVEQIRSAIGSLDNEIAKDTLALLLAEKEGRLQTPSTAASTNSSVQDFSNFAQAINFLKSKYKFQELSLFTTEADLVYVNTGDRKVLITDTTVKPREIQRPQVSQDDYDFENAWEPVAPQSIPSTPVEPEGPEKNDDPGSPENAFEPVKQNGRFNNLEL